ncbi:MAG: hypothetical protein NTW25_11190 [Candidatus Kapabacteria bacterium]|nr:hypothetical protein [Candidatus Kapabacteria bacterium]
MDDKSFQKTNLEKIFSDAMLAPVFHKHHKYSIGKFADMTPYINYSDVMKYNYIIRAKPLNAHNAFDTEDREIIIEYSNLDDLVNDGWRLD